MSSSFKLALLAIAFSLQLNAQVNIKGTVTGEAGESLPAAHIILVNTVYGTVSGSDGSYILRNIPEGNYRMRISFIGFQQWENDIILATDTVINVSLSRMQVLAEEVIIRGSWAKLKDPVAFTNINREQLAGTDRTRDIPYMLELTPSVVVTSDAGTGVGYSALRIRGTDPSRINVTINGIPFNDSESHDVYWVDIPDFVSSVENIQVQRGVGTSTQGAAAFGANINFQTQALSAKPHAEIQTAGGSYNTWKNTVSAGTGLIRDHFSADLRFSSLRSDGYIDRAFAELNSHYLALGWYDKKNILKFTVFGGKELTFQAWGGVPGELLETNRTYNPYTYENEVDDYQQDHYQLHWSSQLFDRLNMDAALHYTRGSGYYEQYREDEDLTDYLLDPVIIGNDSILSSDLIRRKWLDNDFYGGILNFSYEHNGFELTGGGGWNRYDGDHFGRVVWARYASNGEIRHPYYFSNGLKTDWNNFIRINYSFTPGLSLYADMQYRRINYIIDGRDDDQRDISQEHIYNFLNPKAGVTLDISDSQKLYFSFSVGNREPKRSNFTDARPGMEIKPERLNDFELGYNYQSNRFSGGANAYFMDYKDQLVLTGEINDVGSAIMVNVPDSYRLGLELMFAVKLMRSLKWEGNLTVSRNRIENFIEYVDDWDIGGQKSYELQNTSLAFSPGLIASGNFLWNPVEGIEISMVSKYVGSQYIDNTSSPERMLEAYLVNNLRLGYSLKPAFLKEAIVFIQANNILNEEYESSAWVYSYFYEGQRLKMDGYYPQAGRHFLAGLTLRF